MLMSYLFEISGKVSNATLTLVFTKEFGEYKDGEYFVNLNKVLEKGYLGFLKMSLNNTYYDRFVVTLAGGMSLGIVVDKQYWWDKEELICNQEITYHCSKGLFGSITHFIKSWIKHKLRR